MKFINASPTSGRFKIAAALFAVITLVAGTAIVRADAPPPKYTVEEIMKAVFKGEDSTGKKISQGKAIQADYDKLVEYVSSLPLNDAPQGDPAGWKQKTTALLAAATALKEGKPGALAQYTQAANCQACHRVYRPE
jgi:cytochrome c556